MATHSVFKEPVNDGAIHLRLLVHLFHEGGHTLAGELGHCEGKEESPREEGTRRAPMHMDTCLHPSSFAHPR